MQRLDDTCKQSLRDIAGLLHYQAQAVRAILGDKEGELHRMVEASDMLEAFGGFLIFALNGEITK